MDVSHSKGWGLRGEIKMFAGQYIYPGDFSIECTLGIRVGIGVGLGLG